MLNPDVRHLLLEGLRPPEGYRLSYAVGTSFSLDLIALLTAPLAFTFYDWEDGEGELTREPLALLESLRRHAGKIALFCHAGAIKVPPHSQRLVSYLERSVIEVLPKKEGAIFHPKVWVLRYEDNQQAVRYRFLCLSRNLTFDKSWDTVLMLDGVLEDRKYAIAQNHPLGDFISALPGLAVRRLKMGTKSQVEHIADEVRRVRFEMPAGVEDFQFWPIGLDKKHQWPYLDSNRPMLVMSPFVKATCLERLMGDCDNAILISRPDELMNLPEATQNRFSQIYTLDDAADFMKEGNNVGNPELSGLHAKLVVVDDGWDAHLYTGSANATNAAFAGNIEFVTELIGRKKDLGVSAILGDTSGKHTSLASILVPWRLPEQKPDECGALKEELERKLRSYRALVAAHPMEVVIESSGSDYSMALVSNKTLVGLDDAEIAAWPGTYRSEQAKRVNLSNKQLAIFPAVSIEAITGFFAFEIGFSEQGTEVKDQFVLNLPLKNTPKDRFEHLLASMLNDKQQVIRLIWMLLHADGEFSAGGLDVIRNLAGGAQAAGAEKPAPVFEELIKSSVDEPRRIQDVVKLVSELQRSDAGVKLVPEGLPELCNTLTEYLSLADE